ncbi:MAG TPA: YceI family protein [Bdellovibrionota bacterium]|jgi:hypothetical protein|nr:YceI family protein [Bdellovibrionota bacterium]
MVTRRQLSFLIISSLALAPALAQEKALEPTPIRRSEVTLRMHHAPLGRFDTTARDAISPTDLQGPLSFAVSKLESLIPLRDQHMKKVLEAETYPQIFLRELKVDMQKKTFSGLLEAKGKTSPVTGTYTEPERDVVLVRFASRMTAYGIPEQKYLGVGVKDDFEVLVKLWRGPTEAAKSAPLEDPLELIAPDQPKK